jgi:hypothetical protein
MRKTKNELKKLQAAGFYRDVDLGEPEPYHTDIEEKKAEEGGYSLTDDNRYALYEIHADLVIEGVDDEDDLAKPYVVTIERGSGEVLSIRRNYEEDDPLTLKRQHFVHYVYVPGFGFYGLGLIPHYWWVRPCRNFLDTSACRCWYTLQPPGRAKVPWTTYQGGRYSD